jgi:cytoskeletal protein CcmA (bactofilin family)
MFGKKKNGGPTIIGRGATFRGVLEVEGGLQVDGRVEGELEATGGVSVGPDGRIKGEMTVDELALAGQMDGTLVVHGQLHMLSTGVLTGEVAYGTLQVDRGAVIEGRTSREKRPAAATAEEEEDEDVPALTDGSVPGKA